VDHFVDQFSGSVLDNPNLDVSRARNRLWINFLGWVLGRSQPTAQTNERQAVEKSLTGLRIRFEPSHPLAQDCETQAVDHLVDQFRDHLKTRAQT
jgi:hypothetical protein